MYKTQHFMKHGDMEIMALFDAILGISHDGIYVCDKDGNALLFNQALLDISNIPAETYKQYTVHELVEYNIIPKSCAGKTLKSKQKENVIIDYYHGKKAILTSTPLFNDKNELICVVSNVRDITQLNRLEKELEHSNKMNAEYQIKLNEIMSEFSKYNEELIANSKEMKEVVAIASKFANNDSPILLLGETGVGKDVLAQYIHNQSTRSGQFIRVNCGAIPEHLLESELFGYEKGAFTSANSTKAGLFELANKGTIFLDEIADLPLNQQVKLLNVLQERKVRRLGGTKTYDLDIRVIAATNAPLETLVSQKKFRSDLYYRLNVLSITIPPLRKRPDDISAFIFFFLNQLKKKYGTKKRISPLAFEFLLSYSWPGNVRELKGIIERLYHMSDNSTITEELLPSHIKRSDYLSFESNLPTDKYNNLPLKEAVLTFEKSIIEKAIKSNRTLKECAEQLEIDISTLIRKKKRLGIH